MSNKNRFVSALFTSLLLRGHGNGRDADFTQLLKCRSEDDPAFSEWLNRKNQNATLREIQNEILKEMSLSILRIIDESIKNADLYRIMVVETSDVSNKKQAVFCVRWDNENLFSYEDFFGLHEIEKTDAISIENFMKDIIFGWVLIVKN